MSYKIGFVSLGCPKNLVDSEIMIGILSENEYIFSEDPSNADILIVNTCGFIESAKQESINSILEMAKYKTNNCKILIATGCLAERYPEELLKEIPELDAVVGTGNYSEIIEVIDKILEGNRVSVYGNINYEFREQLPRTLSTPHYSAYLKIGDGCNHNCTYCIIPKLRGKYRSRKMENIFLEAEKLAQNGVKELILIAQDTTQYGIDLYGKYSLSKLLEKLVTIEDIEWIRILYSYPERIDNKLIEIMKKNKKICNYLDIPLQHTEDNILQNMGRQTDYKSIKKLITKLRSEIPNISIRTSLIVGFPGETEEQFMHLAKTVEELKLDRVGVFNYSQEENTQAAKFDNQIADEVKEKRRNEIMEIQQNISLKNNQSYLDSDLRVLIEGITDKPNFYFGRSYRDAPEIDGLVYFISEKPLNIGNFCTVKITEALEYDLIGEINDEFTK